MFLCVIPQFVFAAAGNYTSPLSATATNGLNSIFDHQSPNYGVDGTIKVYDGNTASSVYGTCGSINGTAVAYYTATSAGKVCFWYDGHNGLDYNTQSVQGKDVLAAAPGIVREVRWENPSNHSKGFGFYVRLWHSAYGQTTLYGHTTSSKVIVSVGNNVIRSQKIAVSGTTGNSTAPHLHFSVYDGDTSVTSYSSSIDPEGWLGSGQDPWTLDKGYLFAVSPTSLSLFTTVSGGINSSTTWLPGVYVINGTVTVNSGARLTIDRDAVIKFQTAASMLEVADGGVLDAEGTASSAIYFTSYKDDSVGGDTNGDATSTSPGAGDWNRIQIDANASSTISYATIRYGASTGQPFGVLNISNNGGNLTLSNTEVATGTNATAVGIENTSGTSTITSCNIHGYKNGVQEDAGVVNVSLSALHDNSIYGEYTGGGNIALTGNTFYKNTLGSANIVLDGVTFASSGNIASSVGSGVSGFILGGSINANQTWPEVNMPYIIPGTVTVPAGKTLTVNPGAIVKFDGANGNITVAGSLQAQGTSANKIYFTSLKDDSIGGDSNGNGASSGSAGDWDTAEFDSGSSNLTYAVTTYGGHAGVGYPAANLYNNGGTLTVASSTIATSSTYGIYQASGSTTTTKSEIHHQSYGLYMAGGTAQINSSSIHNNTTDGVFNGTTTNINAQSNYWGAANGPSGQGPGSGDAVSTFVDYSNWLSSWP